MLTHMEKYSIKTTGAPEAKGPYSQAVRVGRLFFVSGQLGVRPETGQCVSSSIQEQTQQCLENIGAILNADGLSLSDVVKITCFLKDMRDFTEFNRVYARFFTDTFPARSTVAVSDLPANALVQIDAIAYSKDQAGT